jgi:hypothetical protein
MLLVESLTVVVVSIKIFFGDAVCQSCPSV